MHHFSYKLACISAARLSTSLQQSSKTSSFQNIFTRYQRSFTTFINNSATKQSHYCNHNLKTATSTKSFHTSSHSSPASQFSSKTTIKAHQRSASHHSPLTSHKVSHRCHSTIINKSSPQPIISPQRIFSLHISSRSRVFYQQRRHMSLSTPPTGATGESAGLNQLNRMPTQESTISHPDILKPKLKIRWGLRLVQFCAFLFGFTAAATTALFYRSQIMASYFDALTKYRLWSSGLQDIKEFATPEYLSQNLPITFNGDVDSDIVGLQKTWYHHTYVIRHLMQKIINQITRLVDTYQSQLHKSLEIQGNWIKANYKTGDPEVESFSLLVFDIQELLNNSQLSYGEILEFAVILASTDSDFAINSRRWTQPSATQDKQQFLEHLEYSVHEAVVYIDRMHELLSTINDQYFRLQRLSDFIVDRTGYLEYRQEIIAMDQQRREMYDNQMAQIEHDLLLLQQSNSTPTIPGSTATVANGTTAMNVDDPSSSQTPLTPQEIEKLKREQHKVQMASNASKNPPAMHLNLNQIEEERKRAGDSL